MLSRFGNELPVFARTDWRRKSTALYTLALCTLSRDRFGLN
jgi:hypothetical protein